MAELVYAAIGSLDGFVVDRDGSFEWAAPDEEVHTAVNDLERDTGTHLLGRRMYEVLAVWDSPEMLADESPAIRDYAAVWQAKDKVVYSRTLTGVGTARTRLEREFDPDAVRAMKDAADRDLTIGGPGLAAEALRAGLVDECHLFVHPVVVGGGTSWLPADLRLDLTLVDVRRFGRSGVVHLHYRTGRA